MRIEAGRIATGVAICAERVNALEISANAANAVRHRDGDGDRHLTHVEAESFSADQRRRTRAVVRPPTPGRSTAELQWDRLLHNTDRTLLGVGLRAGDRLGGGVGMFFEWSSAD